MHKLFHGGSTNGENACSEGAPAARNSVFADIYDSHSSRDRTSPSTVDIEVGSCGHSEAKAEIPMSNNDSLQKFIDESHQMLQDFTMELGFRHREFVNALVDHLGEHRRPVISTPQKQMLSSSATPSILEEVLETAVAVSSDKPVPVSEHVLTEDSLKKVLSSELMPLSGLEESLAGMLVPVNTALNQVAADVDRVAACVDSLQTRMDRLAECCPQGGFLSPQVFEDSRTDEARVAPFRTGSDSAVPKLNVQFSQGASPGRFFTDISRTLALEGADSLTKSVDVNMKFAKDMINRFSDENVNDLLYALHKCEEPAYHTKSVWFRPEPERIGLLADILNSNTFERCICVVILLNGVFMTYSTDYSVDHPESPTSLFISVTEAVFLGIYTMELLLKLWVHKLYFFINKDYLWNIFDAALVFGGVCDLLITYDVTAVDSGTNNELALISILRLPRLTKVVRVFRVMRFFKRLNLILNVLLSTLKLLFWCNWMLTIFLYMFAVVFTHGAASFLSRGNASADPALNSNLLDKFGSVASSMLTLYKASTGGMDWQDVSEPLFKCGRLYFCLFLFFVAFMNLALLNILTGLFVDRAMRAVEEDKDGQAMAKLKDDRKVVADLCKFFCAMSGQDLEQECKIYPKQFKDFLSSPVIRARFAALNLEIWDSERFYQMLTSIAQTDEIDLVAFVNGCMQLRGVAKQVSLQTVYEDLMQLKDHANTAQSFQSKLGRLLLNSGTSLGREKSDASQLVRQAEA